MTGSIWRVPGMSALGLMTLFGFMGYSALLPVAPLWAVHGGAGPSGAGLVNGVLLTCTVAAQGFVPGALRRFGWAAVLAGGMLLLGVPAALTGLRSDLGWILAWSAVRGIGFGVLTVCGSTAVAELNAPTRRGEAIGAYGLAVAIPNLVLLPIGPWLAERVGFGLVFALSALPVLAVAPALALARALPDPLAHLTSSPATGDIADSPPDPAPTEDAGTRAVLPRLVRPTLLLLSATLSGGALLTFLPQMVTNTALATLGLALIGLTATVARWRFGVLADRHGAPRFVAPLLVTLVLGLAAAAWAVRSSDPAAWVLLLGVAAVGVAYGGLQNLTLVLAFDAVPRRSLGTASAVWNVGFDAGTGLASVLVGVIAAGASFSAALWVLVALSALALPLTRR